MSNVAHVVDDLVPRRHPRENDQATLVVVRWLALDTAVERESQLLVEAAHVGNLSLEFRDA